MEFYAQHGEDKWMHDNWQSLGLPERGIFVDVGASDGIEHSNTYWLEKEKGWDGICVEADPRVIEKLRMNRSCSIVHACVGSCWDESAWTNFTMHKDQKWSGILREHGHKVIMPLCPLWSVVKHNALKSVDLLSIDTEGTEIDVWRSLPYMIKPALVFVEYATAGLKNEDRSVEIIEYAKMINYEVRAKLGGNLVFVRKG